MDTLTPEEFRLALAVIRMTIIDALNGCGMETLATLFYPMPQAAVAVMLDSDPEGALRRTMELVQRMMTLTDEQREQIRHCLAWSGTTAIKEVLNNAR
jgi:hypothetical protein